MLCIAKHSLNGGVKPKLEGKGKERLWLWKLVCDGGCLYKGEF